MPVSQWLAIIPQRQPGQMAHGHLQQSKAASRDAVMDVSQLSSWESPAPPIITWPLPCPRSPHHLQVSLPWTPPISVFEGLYCVKCHAPHDQSLMTFAQQDQLPSHFSRKSVSMGSPFPVGTQVPVYGCEQPFVNCDSHCVFMWLSHSLHISLMARRGPCPGVFSPTSSYSLTLSINVNVLVYFSHRSEDSLVLFSHTL